MTYPATTPAGQLSTDTVPLRTGPPTKEELLVYYPARFTWTQLKTFVNSGDLGLLKRDRKLQQRYNRWAAGIVTEYGSVVNYLTNYRLQWGKKDTLSLLTSALDVEDQADRPLETHVDFSDPDETPKYFTCDISPAYLSIIKNDWPYSVPPEIEHSLIWTRVPIFHEDLVAKSVAARVEQDGLCGFTGNCSPPPSPGKLPKCLPALAEWGITMDKLIRSGKPTEDEEVLIRRAGQEVHEFVRKRWDESRWETAWFVNPPRLQSIPGLAHIHVFARQKL